jgi:2-polyprenyl-3-methyl-5-hydroxy-6-metoxy-1,4-benzoquinol methylase
MTSIKDERGYNQIFIDSPAAKIRKKRRFDYMISKIDQSKINLNVLEIGCGTGEGISYITEQLNCKGMGLDLSQKFIEIAEEKFKSDSLKFVKANFNNNLERVEKLKHQQFDYIVGNGILHHLYYTLDESLLNLKSLLRPGGKIIFIEPNIYNPYVAAIFSIPYLRKKTFLEPDEMAFSKKFIIRKCKSAGFNKINVEIRDFLLPNTPAMLIKPLIALGNILEKTPITLIAQSIFLTAE